MKKIIFGFFCALTFWGAQAYADGLDKARKTIKEEMDVVSKGLDKYRDEDWSVMTSPFRAEDFERIKGIKEKYFPNNTFFGQNTNSKMLMKFYENQFENAKTWEDLSRLWSDLEKAHKFGMRSGRDEYKAPPLPPEDSATFEKNHEKTIEKGIKACNVLNLPHDLLLNKFSLKELDEYKEKAITKASSQTDKEKMDKKIKRINEAYDFIKKIFIRDQ